MFSGQRIQQKHGVVYGEVIAKNTDSCDHRSRLCLGKRNGHTIQILVAIVYKIFNIDLTKGPTRTSNDI